MDSLCMNFTIEIMIMMYCGWKKPVPTWMVETCWNPVNNGINHRSTGALQGVGTSLGASLRTSHGGCSDSGASPHRGIVSFLSQKKQMFNTTYLNYQLYIHAIHDTRLWMNVCNFSNQSHGTKQVQSHHRTPLNLFLWNPSRLMVTQKSISAYHPWRLFLRNLGQLILGAWQIGETWHLETFTRNSVNFSGLLYGHSSQKM